MTLYPSLFGSLPRVGRSGAIETASGEDANSGEPAVSRRREVAQLGPDLWMLIKLFILLMMIRPF
jgi:hypothetical protein